MFRFATPEYFYLLILVPVLIGVYWYSVRVRRRALERFGDPETIRGLMPEASPKRVRTKFTIFALALVFIVIGLARPQFGSKLKEVTRTGIEMMLAVDVSNSMLAQDFEPNRLERTKFAIDRLIEQLHQDKIGLIVFAGDAYMQLPITSDYVIARTFANNISPTMVSRQGTAIGAAIDLASQSFSSGSDGSRVIVIISDGENHEDDAIAAAKAAAEKGIKIYTIGIGSRKAPRSRSTGISSRTKKETWSYRNSTKRRSNRSPCRPEALTSAPRTAASDSTKSSRRSTKSRKNNYRPAFSKISTNNTNT